MDIIEANPARMDSLRKITLLDYALHIAGPLISMGSLSVIALIINYIKRDNARGTIVRESHELDDPNVLVDPVLGCGVVHSSADSDSDHFRADVLVICRARHLVPVSNDQRGALAARRQTHAGLIFRALWAPIYRSAPVSLDMSKPSRRSSPMVAPAAPVTSLERRRILSALGASTLGVTTLGACAGLPMTTSAQATAVAPGNSLAAAPEPRVRNRDRWRYAITNLTQGIDRRTER